MKGTLFAVLVAIACASCMAKQNDLVINNMMNLLRGAGCVENDEDVTRYTERLTDIKTNINAEGKFVIGHVNCKSYSDSEASKKKMKTACRCETLELIAAIPVSKSPVSKSKAGEKKTGGEVSIMSGIPNSKHGRSEELYQIIIEGEQKDGDNLIHCGYYLATRDENGDLHAVNMQCVAPKDSNDDASDDKDDSSDKIDGKKKKKATLKQRLLRKIRKMQRKMKRKMRKNRLKKKKESRRRLLQTGSCTS